MSQTIHFDKLWGSVNEGLRVYGLGDSYPLEQVIPIEDGGPLVPLSSWRTRTRQYVLAMSQYRWRIILLHEPGPAEIVVTKPAHSGKILGGWVDFKSKAFYCVEQMPLNNGVYPRRLVVWDLDRTPEVKWVLSLPADISSEGGDTVFAGRLDGSRHIAIQTGLTRTALVNISDAWHPDVSGVIADGGAGIAAFGGYLYNQAGQGVKSWLEVYDVGLPQSPVSCADLVIPGVWGDQLGIEVFRVGKNLNRVVSHNTRGNNEDWAVVFDHYIPEDPQEEHKLRLVAEHKLMTPWGDLSVYTVDEQDGTGYLWGHPPGSQGHFRYHVAELDLARPQDEPRIVELPE